MTTSVLLSSTTSTLRCVGAIRYSVHEKIDISTWYTNHSNQPTNHTHIRELRSMQHMNNIVCEHESHHSISTTKHQTYTCCNHDVHAMMRSDMCQCACVCVCHISPIIQRAVTTYMKCGSVCAVLSCVKVVITKKWVCGWRLIFVVVFTFVDRRDRKHKEGKNGEQYRHRRECIKPKRCVEERTVKRKEWRQRRTLRTKIDEEVWKSMSCYHDYDSW